MMVSRVRAPGGPMHRFETIRRPGSPGTEATPGTSTRARTGNGVEATALFAVLALGVAAVGWVVALPSLGASAGPPIEGGPLAPAPATSTFPTPIHHVVVVVLENAKRSTVLQNGPFEDYLQKRYAYASHYYAVCHPSAPNYLAMTAGSTFQCGSDSHSNYSTENLGEIGRA